MLLRVFSHLLIILEHLQQLCNEKLPKLRVSLVPLLPLALLGWARNKQFGCFADCVGTCAIKDFACQRERAETALRP